MKNNTKDAYDRKWNVSIILLKGLKEGVYYGKKIKKRKNRCE